MTRSSPIKSVWVSIVSIWSVLSVGDRARFGFAIGSSVAGSLLETLTLLLVVLVTHTMLSLTPPEGSVLGELFQLVSLQGGALGVSYLDLLCVLLGLSILGSLFARLAFTYFQANTAALVSHRLATKLVEIEARRPFIDIAARDRSSYFAAVFGKTTRIGSEIVLPALGIVSAFTVALFILGGLILMNPVVTTLSILAIVLAYVCISVVVRKSVIEKSKLLNRMENKLSGIINNILDGAAEIRVLGRESFFIKSFSMTDSSYRSSYSAIQIMALAPKYILETFVLMLFVLAVVFANRFVMEVNFASWAPYLAGALFGAQRALPAGQVIFSGWATIQGCKSSLEDICFLLRGSNVSFIPSEKFYERTSAELGLTLDDVSFTYPGSAKPVLQHVNISFKGGEVVGIQGNSGTGKSTLVGLLSGLYRPSLGQIRFSRSDVDSSDFSNHISLVSQRPFLLKGTIAENVAFGIESESIDYDRVVESLSKAQLLPEILARDGGIHSSLEDGSKNFSGGQAQRLAIARGLYLSSDILILDEATNALDKLLEARLLSTLIREYAHGILIIISHSTEVLAHCSSLYSVENRQVVRVESGKQCGL